MRRKQSCSSWIHRRQPQQHQQQDLEAAGQQASQLLALLGMAAELVCQSRTNHYCHQYHSHNSSSSSTLQ